MQMGQKQKKKDEQSHPTDANNPSTCSQKTNNPDSNIPC